MKTKLFIYILISISLFSCQENISLLKELDNSKDVKFYFISSKIMGPNTEKKATDFQKEYNSFYIDDKKAIEILKNNWKYPSSQTFDNFIADYDLTYTEDHIYRGKISIDLANNIAISGYGPTSFDSESLNEIKDYIKPLKIRFFEFNNLNEARLFYKEIPKKWLLPSPNDEEYYKWTEYEGETIIQVNNKKFARDKDIKKAFKKYMPKRFADSKHYYNIFRFTSENSTVRICSNEDLSEKFPEDFRVIVAWKAYNAIILPLINFDESELNKIISNNQLSAYKIIDKIE